MTVDIRAKRAEQILSRIDRPVLVAFACIVALLLLGSLYSRSSFLRIAYCSS